MIDADEAFGRMLGDERRIVLCRQMIVKAVSERQGKELVHAGRLETRPALSKAIENAGHRDSGEG